MKIKGNIVDIVNRRMFPGYIKINDEEISEIVEEEGQYENYIMPGFIDSHVHIESSMLVPSEFARAAVRHGTVAVVSDPHEIANVAGLKGVEYMIENAARVPFKFFFGAPSCVPATNMESSGAVLNINDVKKLLDRKDIYLLSEMMNYPGVIFDDSEVKAKIELAKRRGKPVDGHAPGLRGEDLRKYVRVGITSDHEASDIEEAREKIGLGMKILIREGSAARNMEALAPLLGEAPGDVMLCCDDIHPEMLEKRHIDYMVSWLIEKGYDSYDVLRAASLNVVNHYGIDVGLLRPGDKADFIVVDSIRELSVKETWINGRCVYADGREFLGEADVDIINNFVCNKISEEEIKVKNRKGSKVKVIGVRDGDLSTEKVSLKWTEEEIIGTDPENDILKIVVKDRYADGPPSVAFIRGFGIKKGAFAGSVAHDSHNIVAVGTDDDSIAEVINRIVDTRGGLAVSDGSSISSLSLPVGGIMTDVPCGTIAHEYERLSTLVKNMGSTLKAPFMTLSFMSLLVIPSLKLGDRGLFDGDRFCLTEIFED